ncbi:retrovirus-related pol polyprotein from transposon TNT 1-94 [Tanacetum coccineum]
MLCKPKPYYDEHRKVAIGYKNPLCLTRAKQVQPALYNGHEIIKTTHVPAIVHNSKDTLEIPEITRKKMNDKKKDPKYAIYVEPISPRNRNNREVHLHYLKHLKESVETLREIVEEAKTNVPAPPSTGVNSCTDASRSHPRSNTKKNRILPAKSVNTKQVEEHPRTNKSYTEQPFGNLDSVLLKSYYGVSLTAQEFCEKVHRRAQLDLRNEISHFGAIMGYGDYVIGDSVISRVYYVEGLGHNMFSVGQFCDSDLEVAFRKHSCYVRDIDGVKLIKGSRGSNLYTILVEDVMKSSPICLLSKASKNKSWLWNRRLNHLNFGKSKKHTHTPKAENTNLEVLNTLHMDLCGPMRVQTINGKKYILVIVDDYTRFTWVKFLRLKDETLEFVIKFLKQIQVGLNKTLRYIRTDNGTEFVNKDLIAYYESVGIFHQKTVSRTPQ